METEPHILPPQEVRYPRAADQITTTQPQAPPQPRWIAAIANSLGLVAVIWSIPVAIVIVALPVALVFAVVAWFTRP